MMDWLADAMIFVMTWLFAVWIFVISGFALLFAYDYVVERYGGTTFADRYRQWSYPRRRRREIDRILARWKP